LHAVETVPPSTPFSEWKAVLESLIGEMSNELQGIEADEKRVRDRREMDLKESIRLLNIGPEVNLGTSGEFMPTLLYDALQKRGITPDTNGQFFAPRGGGLRRVTERLAELRKRRVKAIVELEHYCHEYETQTA
jgi:hypothetical protein